MQTNNKLREALENSNGLIEELSNLGEWYESARGQLKENNAALASPPKNCEVGTVEEQLKRQYDTMCNTTKACPDSDWSCRKCFAEWSQMPYEAKERKGKK